MIYVMSDIHGNMSRFESILKQINLQSEDTLYILGDVVDRFPDGIRILRRIMKMSNVKMLLGNHEWMMFESVVELDEDDAISRMWRDNHRDLWYYNGGACTHRYWKHIRKTIRAEIIDYLHSLPVNIDVECNSKKYKLVHASPQEYYDEFRLQSGKYESRQKFAVWHRWRPGDGVPKGYTLIFGHTPTVFFEETTPPSIWKTASAIGIDCGCGFEDGRLGCLRLDDMKEFYSERGLTEDG